METERNIGTRVCSGMLLGSRYAVLWMHPWLAREVCSIVSVSRATVRNAIMIIRIYDHTIKATENPNVRCEITVGPTGYGGGSRGRKLQNYVPQQRSESNIEHGRS